MSDLNSTTAFVTMRGPALDATSKFGSQSKQTTLGVRSLFTAFSPRTCVCLLTFISTNIDFVANASKRGVFAPLIIRLLLYSDQGSVPRGSYKTDSIL